LTRPFGFQLDGQHVPAEVTELRAMYDEVIAGRSMASIAKDLNDRGVPNSTPARWQSATIGFLVRAARNAGLRTHRGQVVGRGAWDPVVDEQTWRDAVAALDARRAGLRQPPRSLLGGIVRCGHCGGAMTRSARSYSCLLRSDGYKHACGLSIGGDRLDEYISGLVLAAAGKVTPSRVVDRRLSTDDVVALHRDLDELAAMFGRGEMTLSAFRSAKAPMDARIAAAEARLVRDDAAAALDRLTGPRRTLRERWDDLDVQLRARIVGTLVEGITVAKAARSGEKFDPARVTVAWRS
jgi:hypothetical protein